ncbi:MAG: nuclear transport factor 2 family protein [Rhizobium sp.]|uniref:nuclear transport factor 2 family protein n=1 Tax=Rhizobium sp. TaxID=391 RepID=UPI000AFD5150
MAEMNGAAVKIARSYIDAIINKDVDRILAISADDVVCNSPISKLTGKEAFSGFQDGFARMITNITVLAVHGDDGQAVVVYDAETYPVPHSIVAELIKVKDGKLASTEVIYDSAPFAEYMKSVQPH